MVLCFGSGFCAAYLSFSFCYCVVFVIYELQGSGIYIYMYIGDNFYLCFPCLFFYNAITIIRSGPGAAFKVCMCKV